jgi:regulator of sigma E protease
VFYALPGIVRTGLAFVVVLGVLVFVHELGHYLAARWRGVRVDVFSIGFGQALVRWTDRVGTEWRIAWIPLGGFVKLHGQERPEDASPEVRASWIAGETFHEKSVASRAIVVAAGPIANFLLAMVLFAALFATAGRQVTLPIAGGVVADSAASRAGLQVDDRIEAIAGQPVHTFEDLQHIISAHPAESLMLTVRRGDSTIEVPVTTSEQTTVGGRRVGMLGLRSSNRTAYQKMSLPAALWGGVEQTWRVLSETATGVAQMIAGQRGADELGGPLRIAQLSGQVADLGLASLISFMAVLSVNLGLINLFPIPVLDGGHLLFFLAEAVRGRPIPQRAQEYGFRAGLALIGALFIFATWNDLSNLGIVHWVARLAG